MWLYLPTILVDHAYIDQDLTLDLSTTNEIHSLLILLIFILLKAMKKYSIFSDVCILLHKANVNKAIEG